MRGRLLGKYCTNSQESRILDRFQTNLSSRRGLQQTPVSFCHRLTGAEGSSDLSIKSPYTARILKPYIRRDYESRPVKLRLLEEIRAYPHRKNPNWVPEPNAPIDYCYVRPNHIPSVNAMCNESYWPGVDLSECLQYPDFSVVVLYKKVVIAFGFMVPDVKYNEAYISFLLVHPEWRRAGIATFMIYHLIQTCMGKDVTLHVSASNAAMLLYQKFGFKAEEYILDFYDKYYPVDSIECRHAFFLRLRR
ncbi:Cysteine-rich protein 2-binding protein [Dissostichus eleginoides]|uniref:Cysteine-rich protein 2-binding protein n=1 Tax=Dissostichus eleginoides TaxID=100907 RepID=A0AAD9EW00_DISEL|nr:Cysteine-rich protein 2-binding protein [Dissostichus eleginoides]